MWRDNLKLNDGDTLREDRSFERGSMGQKETTEYSVLDANGTKVGEVTHCDNTSIGKGFKRTQTVVQKDLDGTVIVDLSWEG